MQWSWVRSMGVMLVALFAAAVGTSRSAAFEPDDLGVLIRDLRGGAEAQRVAAAERLGSLRPVPKVVVPLLAEQLSMPYNRDGTFALAVVAALDEHGNGGQSSRAEPRRVVRLESCSPCTGRRGRDMSGPRWVDSGHREDRGHWRKAAVLLLGERDPETRSALRLLIEGLHHPNVEVRLAACDALYRDALLRSKRETHPAVRPLLESLHDAEPRVRAAAAMSLGVAATGVRGIKPQPYRDPIVRITPAVPDEAIPSLLEALSDTDLQVRVRAAEALTRSGPEIQLAVVPAPLRG